MVSLVTRNFNYWVNLPILYEVTGMKKEINKRNKGRNDGKKGKERKK
jgi:hypothetical protein